MALMKEGQYSKAGIYYKCSDLKDGRPTLVFVHGLSGSMSAWREYEDLSGSFNLLFFGLRGHGRSINPEKYSECTIKNLTADLADLIEETGANNIILVSHSFGALISLSYLASEKNKAAGALFVSPDYRIGETWRAKLLRPFIIFFAAVFSFFDPPKGAGSHIDYSGYSKADWNIRRMIVDTRNTGVSVYTYFLRSANRFVAGGMLEKINVPILILHGDRDTIFPLADSAGMAKKAKNTELKTVGGGNHLLVLSRANMVKREIEEFVKKIFPGEIKKIK